MPCWEEMDVAFGTRGGMGGQQRVGPVRTNEGKPACAKRGYMQAPDPGEEWRWAASEQERRGEGRSLPGFQAFSDSFLKLVSQEKLPIIRFYEIPLYSQ